MRPPVRVLNLVTSRNAPFFEQQVEELSRQGVRGTTLAVPGERRVTDGESSSRSVVDYGRLYPRVLRHAAGPYDLVHANYGLTAPAALAQPFLPVVVTLWGSDLMGKYGRLVAWCARRADAVIVRNEEMAEAVGTDAHVIPSGVDLELFRPIPQRAARDAVGWSESARHVLFPYSTERDVKDYPRAERVVEAAEERLDDEVELQTLSGEVPHERMPLYVNAADALLVTSKREGSPNALKEALACNVPAVSTEVGDARERLDGVEPSRVGRTDDELVGGLVDVLRAGPPSDGRRAVEPLSLDRTGERIRRVYESVS